MKKVTLYHYRKHKKITVNVGDEEEMPIQYAIGKAIIIIGILVVLLKCCTLAR